MHEHRQSPILGLSLPNPVIVGSGLLTDQERNIRRLLELGAGAVVTKTIHPNPPRGLDERLARVPTGMLNSTTYSKRPVEDWLTMLRGFSRDDLAVVASIHADTPAELGRLAAAVSQTGCTAMELGIACINEEFGSHGDTPERVHAFTQAVRNETDVPLSVKLGIGRELAALAEAADGSGANMLTLSDTLPGAAIDAKSNKLALGGVYGYSGPGIKPLVLAAVWQLRESGYRLPIMASGGAASGRDVIDYLIAGASAIQVYTVLHKDMADSLTRILTETTHELSQVADTLSLPLGATTAGKGRA
uniref:dihydroorotate dehydrogenase n=1 Tax=unclassified Rhodococcus (in: high G+C Gram-positive bacteria) TaxID=192944 RepID=UPI001595D2C0|nr:MULTISPECIES: dihydroorotate dehydrogenase [unclassified Rhodococcus (in: high G+C Gram-positive bacteria)]